MHKDLRSCIDTLRRENEIVEIAVAGLCIVKGMTVVRRKLLIWHQEAQEPTTV